MSRAIHHVDRYTLYYLEVLDIYVFKVRESVDSRYLLDIYSLVSGSVTGCHDYPDHLLQTLTAVFSLLQGMFIAVVLIQCINKITPEEKSC